MQLTDLMASAPKCHAGELDTLLGLGHCFHKPSWDLQSGHMHKPDHTSKHQLGQSKERFFFFGFLNEH